MKKRMISLLVLFGLAQAAYADDVKHDIALAFEAGLGVGVDSFEKEYLVQGWRGDPIQTMDYMVLLDVKSCSTKKILLLKDFGYRNGLSPVELSNHTVLFKSFDNRPDAEELSKFLNRTDFASIPEKVYVYQKKPEETFSKAPFAYRTIFEKIQKEIKSDIQILVVPSNVAEKAGLFKPLPAAQKNDINISKPSPIKKALIPSQKISKISVNEKPKPHFQNFSLRGPQVEYFSYWSVTGGSDRFAGRKFIDANFRIKGVLENKGQLFPTSGKVVSANGVSYVKVAGKNMYFDVYNTSLGEKK